MAPGGHGCVDITGLRRTDISYPETAYAFTVSWTDTSGTVSSGSGTIVLDVDKFVGQEEPTPTTSTLPPTFP